MSNQFNGNCINLNFFDGDSESDINTPASESSKKKRKTVIEQIHEKRELNKKVNPFLKKNGMLDACNRSLLENTNSSSKSFGALTVNKQPDEWLHDIPLYPLAASHCRQNRKRSKAYSSQYLARTFVSKGTLIIHSETALTQLFEVMPDNPYGFLESQNDIQFKEIRNKPVGLNNLTGKNRRQFKQVLRVHYNPEDFSANPKSTAVYLKKRLMEYAGNEKLPPAERRQKEYEFRMDYWRETVMYRDVDCHDPYKLTISLEKEINPAVVKVINAVLAAYGIGGVPGEDHVTQEESQIELILLNGSKRHTGINTSTGADLGRNWHLRLGEDVYHPETDLFELDMIPWMSYNLEKRTVEERTKILQGRYARIAAERREAESMGLTLAEYRKKRELEALIEDNRKRLLALTGGAALSGINSNGAMLIDETALTKKVRSVDAMLDRMFRFREFTYLGSTYKATGHIGEAGELTREMEIRFNGIKVMHWSDVKQFGPGVGDGYNRTGKMEVIIPHLIIDSEEREKMRRLINRILKRAGRRYFQLKLSDFETDGLNKKRWEVKILYNKDREEAQYNGTYPLNDSELGQLIDVDFITGNIKG